MTQTQAAVRGLGLGLYICRTIVERHQGRIWAASSPGQGSTFFVELPLDEAARTPDLAPGYCRVTQES